jgi:hypothetical protein
VLSSSTSIESAPFLYLLDSYPRLQEIKMIGELHLYTGRCNFEKVKQLVEGGADIEEVDHEGVTVLSVASSKGDFEIVVFLVESNANVAHTDDEGMTALHFASLGGDLLTVKYLLEHGARITERSNDGTTALLFAAEGYSLEVIQYLLSSDGGASITETNDDGDTALLVAAGWECVPAMVQWLLEYGGAQITDKNNAGDSVWTVEWNESLRDLLVYAYTPSDDGECVPNENVAELTTMLRVMLLHGEPSECLEIDVAPPLHRIIQDGARLRARLPAYFVRRRALLDAHCPLLPPLLDLVHGYEKPTTTDELWATGLGARIKRSKPERGKSPERRSARLRQKCL